MRRNRAFLFLAAHRNLVFFLSFFLILLSAAPLVRAAEEGGGSSELTTDIFKWINFTIVAGVLFWVFGKFLPPKFAANAEKITSAITKASAAKVAADAQVREAETKLTNLQKEIDELRASAQRESAAEIERIRAATHTEALKIAAAAKAEIEAAERAARLELKGLAAKLAVDGAESLLVEQLNPRMQETLVTNFVESLQGRLN